MKIKNLFVFSLLSLALTASAASKAKYIFYFIGDGMGMGAVSLAQAYNRMVLGGDSLLTMMQFPVASMATTHSASSPVTDSAAAGTALSTGTKTTNGMLGVRPDTTSVVSIAKVLHDNGFGVGLVTTVAPDDATPAAFYAHQPYRGMYYDIARDAAECGYEFIAGANLRGTKDKDGNPNDIHNLFEQNQVSVVRGIDGLKDAQYRKVLLLNTDTLILNDVGYTVDGAEGVLTLPAMTQACLDHLMANSPDKFFMMVEGGTIDHAGHANDAAGSVKETLTFDQSLRIAYNFYLKHPDETLIVVTADHETGGLILAHPRLHYDIQPLYLSYPRMSKDRFNEYWQSMLRSRMVLNWEDMKNFLTDKLGFFTKIPVTDAEEEEFKSLFEQAVEVRGTADKKELDSKGWLLVNAVYKHISAVSGIGWTTGDHSGTVVPVFAIGVDSQQFAAAQDNTDIPRKIISIAGYSLPQ